MTQLLVEVNKKRKGRTLTSRDHQPVCWKRRLRDDPKYAWKHGTSVTHVWSGDAVALLRSITDDEYDEMRRECSAHLRTGSQCVGGRGLAAQLLHQVDEGLWSR
ncbi:hypothetical protein [Microbacterium gilvum]|uniref:EC042-2821-like Restriction Endonuclease-like domain-containing protein n=1 Tax=Microbacterium gilvum TaxID=1336204 RepID=A0ABP9ATQ3_9MICO